MFFFFKQVTKFILNLRGVTFFTKDKKINIKYKDDF